MFLPRKDAFVQWIRHIGPLSRCIVMKIEACKLGRASSTYVQYASRHHHPYTMSVAKATGASALKSQYQGVQTNYSSNEVGIPEDFLKEQAHDCQPVRVSRIDFSNTVVPEYAGYYAIILDNVLSPSECQGLLKLAEESAIPDADGRLWRPAMVNIGGNYEMMATDYRNSDRIIWDSQEMINRIWERCLSGEGVQDDLARIDRNPFVQGERAANRGARWRFTRPNERMRFLRYTKGQYFDSKFRPLKRRA